jgi:hypothetical protein
VGDLGRQVERPDAAGLAEAAGRLVDDLAQAGAPGRGEGRIRLVSARGALGQAGHALLVEGVDGVADGLVGAAEAAGDGGGALAAGAG